MLGVNKEICTVDHPMADRLDYIYNGVLMQSIDKYDVINHPFEKRNLNVAYVGSLVPAKVLIY